MTTRQKTIVNWLARHTTAVNLTVLCKEALGLARVRISVRRDLDNLADQGLIESSDDGYVITDTGRTSIGADNDDSNGTEIIPRKESIAEDNVTPPAVEPLADEPLAEKSPETVILEEAPPEQPATPMLDVPIVARRMWESDSITFSGINPGLPVAVRMETVREAALTARLMDDRLGLVTGELLYEISKREYWKDWGFESFDDYIEKELEFKSRKAKYLVSIYEKFVVELSLPIERLKAIQWSKAKELLPVINADNADEMLELAKTKTYTEITAHIREIRKGSKGEGFVRLHLGMSQDQFDNIQTAISVAKDMLRDSGGDDPPTSRALDMIASDFLAGRVGDGDELVARLDMHITNIERTFGVRLGIVTGSDE